MTKSEFNALYNKCLVLAFVRKQTLILCEVIK